MSPARRVLVVAFDAAEPELIERWAAEGALPNWGRLLEAGQSLRLVNAPGLYSGAVWPSLFTGLSPMRHGRYAATQFVPGGYACAPHDRGRYPVTPFWVPLGRAGKRVALIDVPKCPEPNGSVALEVFDWGTHNKSERGFCTHPEALQAEIERDYGLDPVGVADAYAPDENDAKLLRDRLLARIDTKVEMCLELWSRGPWDLFFVAFSEAHCAGHCLWWLHDPRHPAHSPGPTRALGDPLLDVYRAHDAALGRLLAAAGSETTVLVLSSHGMGLHHGGNSLLPRMLFAMQGAGGSPAGVNVAERAYRALPLAARTFLRASLAPLRRRLSRQRMLKADLPLGALLRAPDLAKLRYFAVPNNDAQGAIRLNLTGREPNGLVPPDAVSSVTREIREGLQSFVNEDTLEPVVSAVHPIAELYPGEPTDAFPDLIVEWNGRSAMRRVRSARFGRVEGAPADARSGDHLPFGFLAARGPGLGAPLRSPGAIVDVAPTITELLGAPASGCDGKPLFG